MQHLSWDVLFYVDGELPSQYPSILKNSTACHVGWFTMPELEYKAKNSKLCLSTEVKGQVTQMISRLGCPTIKVTPQDDIEDMCRIARLVVESQNFK